MLCFWGGVSEELQCRVLMRCIFYCGLCVFIWEVNYGFMHIYLDYHTETGQLIIVKQLCQKCFI